jgi:hypothetical protein
MNCKKNALKGFYLSQLPQGRPLRRQKETTNNITTPAGMERAGPP